MDTILSLLGAGILEAMQPTNFMMIVIGCTIGLLLGAMHGLGSVNGVAILLPITFLVPPTAAIMFLAAIYYGAMYVSYGLGVALFVALWVIFNIFFEWMGVGVLILMIILMSVGLAPYFYALSKIFWANIFFSYDKLRDSEKAD